MKDYSTQTRRGVSVETLVAEFQGLSTAKRHLYFYIFLVLVALLGDTIKRAAFTQRPEIIQTNQPRSS